jgi:PBP1b-binding outer membrane lipoprotein LpoB
MKKIITFAILASVLPLVGCVPITYTKTVQVHKDANGRITETIETESITEPHQEMKKIQEAGSGSFQYLNK